MKDDCPKCGWPRAYNGACGCKGMSSARPRTPEAKIARLTELVNQLIGVVETNCCTCPADVEITNARHTQKNRRRKDSACDGVSRAVAAEMRLRRILGAR